VKKEQSSTALPWIVLAGVALLLGWSLFSWRTAAHSPVSEGRIQAPKPETLGIVLPPEPAKLAVVSPAVSADQKPPVKVGRFKKSPERLVEEGIIPPPEEAKRMEKKKIVVY